VAARVAPRSLIDAAGLELSIEVRRLPAGLAALSGPLGDRIRTNRHRLVATAAEFGVRNLRAALEEIVGAPVDIVPATDLKPQVRPRVERESVAL
jgi:hypothetical protein